MNRLVSRGKRSLSQGIDFRNVLNYKWTKNLYERRLKLTKALPIMFRYVPVGRQKSGPNHTVHHTEE